VCGALEGVRKEIKSGFVNFEMDPLDYEYCHLKHRLLSNLPYGKDASISEMTYLAYEVIVKDLEALIAETTKNKLNFDYAVFTGIQFIARAWIRTCGPESVMLYVMGIILICTIKLTKN